VKWRQVVANPGRPVVPELIVLAQELSKVVLGRELL
jgi:hypothetical protein